MSSYIPVGPLPILTEPGIDSLELDDTIFVCRNTAAQERKLISHVLGHSSAGSTRTARRRTTRGGASRRASFGGCCSRRRLGRVRRGAKVGLGEAGIRACGLQKQPVSIYGHIDDRSTTNVAGPDLNERLVEWLTSGGVDHTNIEEKVNPQLGLADVVPNQLVVHIVRAFGDFRRRHAGRLAQTVSQVVSNGQGHRVTYILDASVLGALSGCGRRRQYTRASHDRRVGLVSVTMPTAPESRTLGDAVKSTTAHIGFACYSTLGLARG